MFSHNPLSARYHLEAGEEVSLLTINLSQDGVNQILLKQYSKKELDNMSQKQFEELIVDYIKSNFSLSIGQQEIKLKEGGIKLGSHQTDLKFVLPPVSSEVQEMDLSIPAFKENDQHQTIFSYNINGRNDHLILSSDNNYQSTIIPPMSTQANSRIWFVLIGLGLVSSISIVLLKVSSSRVLAMNR